MVEIIQKHKENMLFKQSMNTVLEPLKELSQCRDGHCKDGAGKMTYMLKDVPTGFLSGQKNGVKSGNFGDIEDIFR